MYDSVNAIYVQYESDSGDELDIDNSPDFRPFKEKKAPTRNMLPMRKLAISSIIGGSSNSSAARDGNAALEAAGVLTESNDNVKLNPTKVQKAKQLVREEATKKHLEIMKLDPPVGLFFDKRADETNTNKLEKDGSHSHKVVKEDHYSLLGYRLSDPNPFFICALLVVKDGGDTASFAAVKRIVDFFSARGLSMDSIRVVGTDGETTNTGSWNGIVRRLEEALNRPLQRVVCLIHMNELPLKRIMRELVGKSNGLRTYHGQLGQLIDQNLELLPLVKFVPVSVSYFPEYSDNHRSKTMKLRSDQDYLYQICLAVISGNCPAKLLRTPPGEIGHARWLTTANRILRLYIATEDPTTIPHLTEIVHYIVGCYAPVFFGIRNDPNIFSGSRHYFQMVKLSRNLSPSIKGGIEKVLRDNSYFAHTENILLSMLTDKDEDIRKKATEIIYRVRIDAIMTPPMKPPAKRPKLDREERLDIRYFVLPKVELDFSVENYWEMLDLDIDCFEPLLAIGIDLSNFICPRSVPCHTQDVEKYVQDVSKQARRTCSEAALNANIYVISQFRNKENEFKKVNSK